MAPVKDTHPDARSEWSGSLSKHFPLFPHKICSRSRFKYESQILNLVDPLYFATKFKVKKMQVMGDSMTVIDWDDKRNNVSVVRLKHLLQDIQSSLQSFEWTSFTHIYIELTKLVDDLSKQELQLIKVLTPFMNSSMKGNEGHGIPFLAQSIGLVWSV
jgi:hypothetical protein